ncbi:MAG: F0F1 ATP synthase subunit B [Candidatus Omnitrophica bacterium]|nr:F0F1 ATP synthase subunit B [Candidatus Omnitrophota bacterium]
MELFKLLNPQMILAQMVCFALVLLVLKQFLWRPVFKVLEDRRKMIEDQIQSIEGVKAETVRLRVEMEKALASIEDTAQKRLREVEVLGEQKSREIKEKARVEAERIIDDARSELRFELMRCREALKGEVVDMVIKVTEQMIQEKLTFDQDKKLIEGLLSDLEKANER